MPRGDDQTGRATTRLRLARLATPTCFRWRSTNVMRAVATQRGPDGTSSVRISDTCWRVVSTLNTQRHSGAIAQK
jgi:hypothetical protein